MDLTTALIVVVAVVFMVARRLAGEPLKTFRLVVFPLAIVAIGAYQMAHVGHLEHLGVDAAAFGIGVLTAVAGGIVRGLTVRVFVRDGHVWYRYTWVTVAVWAALIAARIGQAALGAAIGADHAFLGAALPLLVGLSFLGESAVVGKRAIATGAPFAPKSARRPAASYR